MRFLRKHKVNKTFIIISDLHLGAGYFINGTKNNLEDFHYDQELVQLFEFYCEKKYQNREVELIINGDFLDFLAVPYVKYFDDTFWRDDACLDKLKLIMDAHKEVFSALKKFINNKNKKVVYILGNHDAELSLELVRKHFLDYFDNSSNIEIKPLSCEEYRPTEGVVIKHGHEYEMANTIIPEKAIVKDKDGRQFLIPPWGSYYITRVINRFKSERKYVNAVRPIKRFIIDGMIYDTFFTLRFLLASFYYFIMVRFIYYFKSGSSKFDLIKLLKSELGIFKTSEDISKEAISNSEADRILIVGHTHFPEINYLPDNKIFINTGTWTNMYNLEFGKEKENTLLTYAKIDVLNKEESEPLHANLLVWKGIDQRPFTEFS